MLNLLVSDQQEQGDVKPVGQQPTRARIAFERLATLDAPLTLL